MTEWFKVLVLKTKVLLIIPWVRILLYPLHRKEKNKNGIFKIFVILHYNYVKIRN